MPTSNILYPRSKNGFTFVEILVVVILGIMIMMTVSALFITSLSTRAKSTISGALKGEGTRAMNQMQFLLRNAQPLSITECDNLNPDMPASARTEITFKSQDNGLTTLEALPSSGAERRIASNSAGFVTPYYLIDENITVGDTLVFSCVQGFTGEGQYISIDFTLTKTVDGGSTVITEDFSSGVQIRNTTSN